MSDPPGVTSRRSPAGGRIAFAVALAVQLVVLYAPRAPSTGGLPIDKVVHAVIFGAVLWTASLAALDLRLTGALLAVHAVASELIQHFVLPGRSGDWTDTVADLAGMAIVTLSLRRRNR